MPPQEPLQTAQQPSGNDFGFMMDQKPLQPAGQGPAGRLTNLGKPAKIVAGLVVVFIIVIVVAMIFSGGGDTSSKQVLDLLAQNQEIVRASSAQDQKFTDVNTKGLSATTQAALGSQQLELSGYLAKTKYKYDPKQLASKTSVATDTQLQTAAQNNNLDDAYADYLKTSLTAYLNSLSTAYKITSSKTLKANLQSAYDSVSTLLESPQFKS